MPVNRKPIFDAAKILGARFVTAGDVSVMDKAIDVAMLPFTPAPPVAASGFVLGEKSRAELVPIRPELRACVELAIGYSPVDFRVNQGERTIEEQRVAVNTGHSRTMHSKHLRQPDGWVWAVDLVTLVNGVINWEFNRYAGIAWAMDKAATELKIASHIRWGCAWDRVLSDFNGDVKQYLAEAEAYAKRFRAANPGKTALSDAPHFEWVN